jgi:hypothetical protein
VETCRSSSDFTGPENISFQWMVICNDFSSMDRMYAGHIIYSRGRGSVDVVGHNTDINNLADREYAHRTFGSTYLHCNDIN